MVDDFQKHLGTLAIVALFTAPVPAQRVQIMRFPPLPQCRSESVGVLTYHQRLRCARRLSYVSPDSSADRGRLHLYRDADGVSV
jgi:hypothetical protein